MPIGGAQFSKILETARLDYLPDVQSFREFGQGAQLDQEIATEWRERTAANFLAASQIGLAANVESIGIPLTEVRDMGAQVVRVYDLVSQAMGSGTFNEAITDALSEAAVALDVTEDAVGIATEVASVVPIIGAIVSLVFGFVDMVKRIKQEEKEARDRPTGAFSSFVPEADELSFRTLIQKPLVSVAWTDVWSPIAWDRPTFAHVKLPQGLRIEARNTASVAAGIPGTASLARSWELSDRGGRAPRVQEVGETLPTATQQATWLWGRIAANSPALFTVDTIELEKRWSEYLRALATSVQTLKPRWRDAFLREGDRQFGWSIRSDGEVFASPIRSLRMLRKRQLKALDTITVAYLDPAMPSLTGELHRVWSERKRQLLGHPARMLVDMTNVPDPEYYKALAASGVPRFAGPSGFVAQTGKRSVTRSIREHPSPAITPGPSALPPMPPIRVPTKGGGFPGVVLGAGIVGGLFLLSR